MRTMVVVLVAVLFAACSSGGSSEVAPSQPVDSVTPTCAFVRDVADIDRGIASSVGFAEDPAFFELSPIDRRVEVAAAQDQLARLSDQAGDLRLQIRRASDLPAIDADLLATQAEVLGVVADGMAEALALRENALANREGYHTASELLDYWLNNLDSSWEVELRSLIGARDTELEDAMRRDCGM